MAYIDKDELCGKYDATYKPLVKRFCEEIKGVQLTGIQQPHLPLFGELYHSVKTKIAFYGIETNGYYDLPTFVNKAQNKDYIFEIIDNAVDEFTQHKFMEWGNNFHSSFWDFILEFLSVYYQRELSSLKDGSSNDILNSFIWGNTNSIESYEVSAKQCGAKYEDWETVKKSSLLLDQASHIIEAAHPDIIFVNNWQKDGDEKWISDNGFNEASVLKYPIDSFIDSNCQDFDVLIREQMKSHLKYYYRPESKTHIFVSAHPRYIYSSKIGFKNWATIVCRFLTHTGIIAENHSFEIEEPKIISDREKKMETIGKLAVFLANNDQYMSGQELAKYLNRNGIKAQNGTEYSVNGGRGIYRVIKNAWVYFQDIRDYQTAYCIARSFKKENGDYAY